MYHYAKLFTLIFLSLFLLNGCDNKQKEPAKVGFLIHAFDSERWENDLKFFIGKVQELGGTVKVEIADNNANKQIGQAKELLNNGIEVLVVVPVDQIAAAEIVNEAHNHNVKVISYDRLIKNCKLDYYVSTDNVKVGELQANYLTRIKPVGNYALIGGAKTDHNSVFLYVGQMNELQPLVEKGDVKIIYNQFTENWGKDEGYEHTKKILNIGKGIDAIIAGNDAVARGVIKALRETGKDDNVLLAGMDADLENLQEIVAGRQTCTIYKPYQKMATTAAELAIKIAKSEGIEKPFNTISNGEILVPTFLFDGTIVNRENLKLTVISEGYQKEEEVFKKK
jgi:D-xylose transport system substrate-binding protein